MARLTLPQGRSFDLSNPDPRDVHVSDIVRSLERQRRYLGHVGAVNVLDHSLWVACAAVQLAISDDWSENKIKTRRLWEYALLHDAHEAYVGDMAKPVSETLGEMSLDALRTWKLLKFRVQQAICAAADISIGEGGMNMGVQEMIDRADAVAVYFEAPEIFTAPLPINRHDVQTIKNAKPIDTMSPVYEFEAVFRTKGARAPLLSGTRGGERRETI